MTQPAIAPAAAPEAQPRILILYPDAPGGIRSLFDQMRACGDEGARTRISYFASHDDRPFVMLRFPLRLVRFGAILRSGNFALCHINLASRGSTLRKLLFAMMCRAMHVPYVIHLHGAGFREFFAGLPAWGRHWVKHFFGRAAGTIVLGRIWQDFVVGNIAGKTGPVWILPNAVAGPKAVPDRVQAPVQILFLGRLGVRKGVPELLEALAAIPDLPWRATIAGDGDVGQFRRKAADNGVDGRIDFPGWVDGSQAAKLLATSHILVLPSHAENLPLSLLEGMAYGLLAVVTPVGAVPDVIRDGENGVLVPVGNAQALGAALRNAISDQGTRLALAARARRDFEEKYDISGYRARLEEIYLSVPRVKA